MRRLCNMAIAFEKAIARSRGSAPGQGTLRKHGVGTLLGFKFITPPAFKWGSVRLSASSIVSATSYVSNPHIP